MRKTVRTDPRLIVLFVIFAILFGFLCDAVIDAVERFVYPEDYKDLVLKYSEEYSVPHDLVFAVIKTESDFESDAVSSAGAIGLMQMLPETHAWLASKLDEPAYDSMLYNPEVNIKYGTYYLQYLYSRFGTWEKALIAYNWGEGNLSRYLEDNEYNEGDYSSNAFPRETQNYVKKVLHHRERYEDIYNH